MPTSAFSITAMICAAVLSAIVLFRERQRSLNGKSLFILLVLIAATEGADLYAITHPESWQSAKKIAMVCEALSGTAWILFGLSYARISPLKNRSLVTWGVLAASLVLPIYAMARPAADFYFSPDFVEEKLLFLSESAYWFYFVLMFLMMVAAYHLERAFMALPSVERRVIIYDIFGAGVVLVAMVMYFSQAFLHRTIDMNLMPVRSVVFVAGMCLCGFSRLKQGTPNKIHLSRDVASRSVFVIALCVYMILLGGVGELLRFFGPDNQRLYYMGFALLSALVLFIYLLSEKNRRKLKVILHKHFYRQKYDYRKEWLDFTRQLSTTGSLEKIQDAILSFYCETFSRKGACLYLKDPETGSYQQKSSLYLSFPQSCLYADHLLIRYFETNDRVFNVGDNLPEEFEALKRQFASFDIELCIPLQYEGGVEGFILLGLAAHSDESLSFEDYDLMKMLASQATSVLLSRHLSSQLTAVQEMAAIGRVSTFVIHDLKNHVSNLTLMLDNAKEHIDNREFQEDMLDNLDETIEKMKHLITRLKDVKEKNNLNLVPANLAEVVSKGAQNSGVQAKLSDGVTPFALIDSVEIEKVVHNLILNAHEASTGETPVEVHIGADGMAFFEVTDRGCGMSEDFLRNRLFKPFQTTKKKGFGIGLFQCRQIIEAHGGRIEVFSKEGEGSRFKVCLPQMES